MPTICRRASPRRSSPAPAPTSSWRSATGRSSMPTASPMSSDVAEEIGKDQGGYYDVSRQVAHGRQQVDRRAVVHRRRAHRLSQILARGGRLRRQFPQTWDDFRAAGKKLKATGRPIGQTAGHTFGDAPGWWYPYPVVVGRQGGRGRRQDRRAEQQGDGRVGQVRGRRCGRRRWTRAGSPGTTPTTTAPSCRGRSAPPTTAPRSISKPRASPTPTRPRRARR